MNIDQIIGKLMGDGSIGEEKSALDAWKKEAEENIRALEDMRKISALSGTLSTYQDFDVDNAWDSFSNEMDENDTIAIQPKVKQIKQKTAVFSIRNLAKIAAILVVVLGSLFLFNEFGGSSIDGDINQNYSATVNSMNFDLNDGTNVTLDKSSDLKVLSDRNVSLTGRAYFDVHRDVNTQFKIDLPYGNIVVLGTEFSVDAKETTTEIYVSEGSVRYELANRTWVLEAGDLVKVINNEVTFLPGRDENIDSWKNQILKFRDNNMVEVVDALSRHFKKDIVIEDPKKFKDCNVYDTFTNASLDDILNGLAKTHSLQFEIRNKKIFIVSAKC